MKKKFQFFIVLIMFFIVLPFFGHTSILLIDDFNDASKPNFIGGDFGSWNKDRSDTTQSCVDSFSKEIHNGNAGFALKLAYDVDSPNPAYNGFWMSLNDIDLRDYNTLVFYIKGDEMQAFTKKIKVELKAKNGEIGRLVLDDISNKWKKMSIPFARFKGLTDWSSVSELIFVFDDSNVTQKDGVIYIDDISFQTI